MLSSPPRRGKTPFVEDPRSTCATNGSTTPTEGANLYEGPALVVARHAGWHWLRRRYFLGVVVLDVLAAFVAMSVCYAIRPEDARGSLVVLGEVLPYPILLLSALPIWVVSLALAGAYGRRHLGEVLDDFRYPVRVGVTSMAVVAIASFVLHAGLSRSLVLCYFPVLIASSVVGRLALHRLLASARRHGRGLRRLLLVGDVATVRKVADHLGRNRGHGYDVVAACTPGAESKIRTRRGSIPSLGHPDDVTEIALDLHVDAVAVLGDGRFSSTTLQGVAWRLESSKVDLLVAPDVVELAGPRIEVAPILGLPLLHITDPRIGGRALRLKSLCERLLCIPLLVLALPVMGVVALAVLVGSGRPILFRQERVGEDGRTFSMLKFRTMVRDAEDLRPGLARRNEHDGALFKIHDDPRVTGVGKVLRRYSLDELPQLFNVLAGEMVLVGPRPCLVEEAAMFGDAAHRRFKTKPGLTGLWQVSGRQDLPWDEAVRLDLYYVENWSPLLDLVILCRTLRVILRGRGC